MIFSAFILVCGKQFLCDNGKSIFFGEIILVRKKNWWTKRVWGPIFVNSEVSDYKVLTIQVGAVPALNLIVVQYLLSTFQIESQMMLEK